jgi:regulator of RNase E activity RraA
MVKTADLCDDYASELTLCRLELNAYGGNTQFAGPIATVKVLTRLKVLSAGKESGIFRLHSVK